MDLCPARTIRPNVPMTIEQACAFLNAKADRLEKAGRHDSARDHRISADDIAKGLHE